MPLPTMPTQPAQLLDPAEFKPFGKAGKPKAGQEPRKPVPALERPTVLRQLVRFSLPGRFALPPVRYFRMYQPEAKAFQGDGKTASYPFKVE
jgi:hypothetical protein